MTDTTTAPEPEAASAPSAGSGFSRRGLIRNAAGAGAVGLAAGLLLNASESPAQAAEPDHGSRGTRPVAASGRQETLIVHVRDAKSGELDIFHGQRHRRVLDRKLVEALLHAVG
jgi:hypothetical protein